MKVKKFLEFKKSDLDPIKSFRMKDNLNPKIWNDFEIDSKVREELLRVAQDFYNGSEVKAEVLDIVLVGSLCNYNWSSKYSDYDLHTIIRYSDVDEDPELVKNFCDYAKKSWNDVHDINIKGFPVEVAIQDIGNLKESISTGRMGGVFSLLNNKWVKKPVKVDFEPDEKLIAEKASSVMSAIDDIEENVDDMEYPVFEEKVTKLWKKIKDYRQSGLDSESGELSVGNLVFKLLRRNGYTTKIIELKRKTYDKQFK